MFVGRYGGDSAMYASDESIGSQSSRDPNELVGGLLKEEIESFSYERDYPSFRGNPREMLCLGGDSAFEVGLGSEATDESLRGSVDDLSSAASSIYRASREAKILNGHTRGVWRVRPLSAEKVVSMSYDRTAKVWDVVSGSCIRSFRHRREVLSSTVCDEQLLTGSSDGFIQIHDGATFESGGTINEPKKSYNGFYSLTSIGNGVFASGPCQKPPQEKRKWNYAIKIWNINSGKYFKQLDGHTGGVSALESLEDTKFVSCSADKTVRVWNYLTSDEAVSVLTGHDDYIYGMCKVDNTTVFSGGKDRKLIQWDIEAGERLHSYVDIATEEIAHASTIYDVCRVTKNLIASCSRDGYVKLWDTRNGKVTRVLDPEDGFVYSVCALGHQFIVAATAGRKPKNRKEKAAGNLAVWDYRK